MAAEVNAKAPGKILWLGGYAVVEKGNIALTSTVNAYVNARILGLGDNSVEISAPDLGMSAKGIIDPSSGTISASVPKELLLLKTAAEVTLRYLASTGIKVGGFRIETKNDSQFSVKLSSGKMTKSGLGSSAAVTVATVGGILKMFSETSDREIVHKLSQIAHSLATGKVGSGFDIAAATYGSMIYKRCSPQIIGSLKPDYSNDALVKLVQSQWDYYAESFEIPEQFKLSVANFVGEAMITMAAVGSVNEFKKNNPEKYAEIIKAIDREDAAAIDELRKIKKGSGSLEEFKAAFERGRTLSKALGVLSNVGIEPDDCTELIDESKNHGAFVAKLPGAGGKDSVTALSLSNKDRDSLRSFWSSKKELTILDLKIDDSGFIG